MALTQSAIFALNVPIVTNGSLGASFESPGYEVKEVKTLAIQAFWTGGGSPVGNMWLAGSVDGDVNKFTRIQGSNMSVSGNSGSNGWNVADIGYAYIRVEYDRISGTASVDIKIAGKII